MNMDFGSLRMTVVAGVATITLNNVRKRNAFDMAMREGLAQAVAHIKTDRSVRAVVITGAGDHFCSGGDLTNISQSKDLGTGGWRNRLQDVHGWIRDLLVLDRPVIAACDGASYGAGFSLALLADIVLATPRARFCMSFMKVGLVPDCGAFYTLPRVVGVQRAKELMMSARELDVNEAKDLGIVLEVHAPDQLLVRAQAMAASFAKANPAAISMVKRAMGSVGGTDLDNLLDMEASAQALAMHTPEHEVALQAFLDKKAPPYSWTPPAKATA